MEILREDRNVNCKWRKYTDLIFYCCSRGWYWGTTWPCTIRNIAPRITEFNWFCEFEPVFELVSLSWRSFAAWYWDTRQTRNFSCTASATSWILLHMGTKSLQNFRWSSVQVTLRISYYSFLNWINSQIYCSPSVLKGSIGDSLFMHLFYIYWLAFKWNK